MSRSRFQPSGAWVVWKGPTPKSGCMSSIIEDQWVELLGSGDLYWLPGEKVAGGDYPGAHAWPIILWVGKGARHSGHLAWKPLLCELPPEAEGTEQAGV